MICCLRRLEEHVRGVLVLRYQQGLSFEELSALFGQQPATLRARMRRVLPRLRANVEREIGGAL